MVYPMANALNNNNFDTQMEARGYNVLLPSSGGICHCVKIKQNTNGLMVFYGGADDNRWSTAKVDVLCQGDGIIPDPSEFCQNINNKFGKEDKTDGSYRVSIIVSIVLVLLIVYINY